MSSTRIFVNDDDQNDSTLQYLTELGLKSESEDVIVPPVSISPQSGHISLSFGQNEADTTMCYVTSRILWKLYSNTIIKAATEQRRSVPTECTTDKPHSG